MRPFAQRVNPHNAAPQIRFAQAQSPHFVGRPDTEQIEPGRKNNSHPLNQRAARQGLSWIILDNEA
jgi:hypothetical protein